MTFGIGFEQHFDTRYLLFYNPSPPRMFPSLDPVSEYYIQHGAIGLLYVTSSYSTWIFCRGVSGFATDYPCDVWCRGLTTCLLHVGPPFGNRFLNTSWAVGLTYWIVYLQFWILTYAIIYVLIHHIVIWLYLWQWKWQWQWQNIYCQVTQFHLTVHNKVCINQITNIQHDLLIQWLITWQRGLEAIAYVPQ